MQSDTAVCEQCRPIVAALTADVAKTIDEMLAADSDLVRHYAMRHGLIEGTAAESEPSHPRDVAMAVLHILQEPEAGVSEDSVERLRIRAALLQNITRSGPP